MEEVALECAYIWIGEIEVEQVELFVAAVCTESNFSIWEAEWTPEVIAAPKGKQLEFPETADWRRKWLYWSVGNIKNTKIRELGQEMIRFKLNEQPRLLRAMPYNKCSRAAGPLAQPISAYMPSLVAHMWDPLHVRQLRVISLTEFIWCEGLYNKAMIC